MQKQIILETFSATEENNIIRLACSGETVNGEYFDKIFVEVEIELQFYIEIECESHDLLLQKFAYIEDKIIPFEYTTCEFKEFEPVGEFIFYKLYFSDFNKMNHAENLLKEELEGHEFYIEGYEERDSLKFVHSWYNITVAGFNEIDLKNVTEITTDNTHYETLEITCKNSDIHSIHDSLIDSSNIQIEKFNPNIMFWDIETIPTPERKKHIEPSLDKNNIAFSATIFMISIEFQYNHKHKWFICKYCKEKSDHYYAAKNECFQDYYCINCSKDKNLQEVDEDKLIQHSTFVLTTAEIEESKECLHVEDEEELILSFFEYISIYEPDMIVGFNDWEFDWMVVMNNFIEFCDANIEEKILELFPVKIDLDKLKSIEEISNLYFYFNKSFQKHEESNIISMFGDNSLIIDSRVVFVKYIILKGSSMKLNDYANTIGEEKEDLEYAEMIEIYETGECNGKNIEDVVEYAIEDAKVLMHIWNKHEIVLRAQEVALMSLHEFVDGLIRADEVKTGKIIEYYAMKICNIMVPDKIDSSDDSKEKYEGALVIEPWFKNINYETPVAAIDFASLYPSIIMGFNLSPNNIITEKQAKEYNIDCSELYKIEAKYINSDNNIKGYILDRKEDEVYKIILTVLKNKRSEFKKEEYDFSLSGDLQNEELYHSKELALKIFMNTFYGSLGTKYSVLYNELMPGAITNLGQELLEHSKKFVESHDWEVMYGDTDSLYIRNKTLYNNCDSTCDKVNNTIKAVEIIENKLNESIKELFGTSLIKMVYEETLMPSEFCAKKKYYGTIHVNKYNDTNKLLIKGIIDEKGVSEYCIELENELLERIMSSDDNVMDIIGGLLLKISEQDFCKIDPGMIVKQERYKDDTKNTIKKYVEYELLIDENFEKPKNLELYDTFTIIAKNNLRYNGNKPLSEMFKIMCTDMNRIEEIDICSIIKTHLSAAFVLVSEKEKSEIYELIDESLNPGIEEISEEDKKSIKKYHKEFVFEENNLFDWNIPNFVENQQNVDTHEYMIDCAFDYSLCATYDQYSDHIMGIIKNFRERFGVKTFETFDVPEWIEVTKVFHNCMESAVEVFYKKQANELLHPDNTEELFECFPKEEPKNIIVINNKETLLKEVLCDDYNMQEKYTSVFIRNPIVKIHCDGNKSTSFYFDEYLEFLEKKCKIIYFDNKLQILLTENAIFVKNKKKYITANKEPKLI